MPKTNPDVATIAVADNRAKFFMELLVRLLTVRQRRSRILEIFKLQRTPKPMAVY
ncbi:MAG: hypothetical protein KME52_05625 [Desmonostoc geniculatum HA4340-LM1]|nr:hypothetical protein [Desmonostoc geniculatum HA4340-LM1]